MRIRSPNLKAPWTICLKHSLIPRCTLWKRCPIARELTIGAHLFRVWQLLSHLSEVPQTNQMIHVIICNNTTFTQNRRKHGCACNMFFPVSW